VPQTAENPLPSFLAGFRNGCTLSKKGESGRNCGPGRRFVARIDLLDPLPHLVGQHYLCAVCHTVIIDVRQMSD
jgi:hypothetical protein